MFSRLQDTMSRQVWVYRAGINGEYELLFIKNGIIGISTDLGINLPDADDYKEFKRKILSEMNIDSKTISNAYSIQYRMQVKDYVLVPSKITKRTYHVGIIESDVIYNTMFYPIRLYRRVKWLQKVSKDEFNDNTQHSMGSLITIFKVNASESSVKFLNDIEKEKMENV